MPHYVNTIKVTVKAPATRDANGNWTTATSTTTELKGRWEVNAKGLMVAAIDGQQIVYSGVIYLPKGTARPPVGAEVEVWSDLVQIAKGTVKNFYSGHFNCTMWL